MLLSWCPVEIETFVLAMTTSVAAKARRGSA